MSAGELNERIKFLQPDHTQNEFGSEEGNWTELADTPEVWAKVKTNASKPEMQGDKLEYKTTYEIKIRYRDDIDERYRITWRGITIKITGLQPTIKRDYLIISAEHIDG